MVKFHVCLGISQTSATLGNPVRGYPLVVHSKSLRELPAMTYETSKCQQMGKFSCFIDFSSISQTHFKKLDSAIPNNFHFYVGKDRCGLEKTSGYFLFQFQPQMG